MEKWRRKTDRQTINAPQLNNNPPLPKAKGGFTLQLNILPLRTQNSKLRTIPCIHPK